MLCAVLLFMSALALVPIGASAQSWHGSMARANGCLRILILKPGRAQQASATLPWTVRSLDSAKPFSETALALWVRHMLKTASRRRLAPEVTATASSCVSFLPSGDKNASFSSKSSRIAQPDSHAFDGYPSVGKLFFNSIIGRRNCTAEVITSPKPLLKGGSDLILTAAHCVVFDYSLMIVSRSRGIHHNLGYYTGWNGFYVGVNSGLSGVNIIGYSENSPKPLISTTDTFLFGVGSSWYLDGGAPGEGDGSSGGPWFGSLNAHRGIGILIGDTGGYHEGGPSSGVPTFSPLWTTNFLRLVEYARKRESRKRR